jgi:hypothetical protein
MADLLKPRQSPDGPWHGLFDRQKRRCCKRCNRTILVESRGNWTVAGLVLWQVAFCREGQNWRSRMDESVSISPKIHRIGRLCESH